MYVLDEVTTNKLSGFNSRGDHYDWCRLLGNDTLEFGNEQGNYQGGTTLSYRWYGENIKEYPEDHIPSSKYWSEVKKYLKYYKKENYQFYSEIYEMCNRNNSMIFKEYLTLCLNN